MWNWLPHIAILASLWRPAAAIMDPSDAEKRLAWKYPDCSHLEGAADRPVDWPGLRRLLNSHPYPSNLPFVFDALNSMRSESAVIDEEARMCFMGVPAVFFYICQHTVDMLEGGLQDIGQVDEEQLKNALMQYSIVNNYLSVLHPGLVDKSNWTITDSTVSALRRRMLWFDWQVRKRKGEVMQEPPLDVKVYVYEEEEVPQLAPLLKGHSYCGRGQWGAEVQLHDFFLNSACRTDNPREADFFFVPGYSICALEGNMQTMAQIDEVYKSIVRTLPYFNETKGRDHIFPFVSGMAHNIFSSWEDFIPRSIGLTPETELFNDFAWISTPPFQTWRDIVIPGSLDLVEVLGLASKSKPLAERKYLAAFFGRVDVVRGPHPWVGGADVRRDILRLRESPGGIGRGGDLIFDDKATHDVMHAAYGSARFCFVPRGKSGWSLRFFEGLFAGCVIVLLSDRWELPFENLVDVTRFVIKWPSARVGPELLDYLRSLPDSVVQQYMDEAKKARCWYFYPPKRVDVRSNMRLSSGICPEEDGKDAFMGILWSLRAKRRPSRTAPASSFYFRDATGKLVRTDEHLLPMGGHAGGGRTSAAAH